MEFIIKDHLPLVIRPLKNEEGPIFIVIGPNAGGVRKTGSTKEIGSAFEAMGHKVLYVCADPGLAALSKSMRVGWYDLEYFPSTEVASFKEDLLGRALQLRATVIIIDLGSNTLLNAVPNRMVRECLTLANNRGCRTFVVISLISPKTGIVDDALNFANRFSSLAKVVLFFHGRESGADFSDYDRLLEANPLTVEVPNKHPAMVDFLSKEQLTPLDFALSAGPPFEMVAGLFAEKLIKFASQPAIAQMLGYVWSAPPQLTAVAKRAPSQQYANATERWQILDEVLLARQNEILTRFELLNLGRNVDDAKILEAAKNFIAATDKCSVIEQSAKNSAGSTR